jgi:tetratricopeptide (TPR) repeat protein
MKNRIYVIAAIAVAISLLGTSGFYALNAHKWRSRVVQKNNMINKMASELSRAREEKDKIAKANEKLQADSISYLAINSKLNNEKDQMSKRLESAQKIVETREANLQRAQQKLTNIEKNAAAEKKARDEKLAKEKRALEKKVLKSASTIRKERGLYHYNLGVAYAQAKFSNEAIEEYEKAIKFDPSNADAYYNLGLLYETVDANPEKAIANYRKYLEIGPDPEDIDEVNARIKRMGG